MRTFRNDTDLTNLTDYILGVHREHVWCTPITCALASRVLYFWYKEMAQINRQLSEVTDGSELHRQ